MKTQDQNSVKPDTQSCQMAVTASCGNDNEVVVFTYKQLRDIAQMNETIGLYLKIAYPEVFK